MHVEDVPVEDVEDAREMKYRQDKSSQAPVFLTNVRRIFI